MTTIIEQGFEKLSPIQAQAWPYLLVGKDVIAIAQTGAENTLAFLLPAFAHVDSQRVPRSDRGGPNVLVMYPTWVSALQIEREVRKYEYCGIKSACLYERGNRRNKMGMITDGVQIIIATPGRLSDLVQVGRVNVEAITFLILDEADKMLDMGLEPQIRNILLDIRPDRQTFMTSSTWSAGVQRLVTTCMSNPVKFPVDR